MEPYAAEDRNISGPGWSWRPGSMGGRLRIPLATSTPKELDRLTRIAGEHLDVDAVCATLVDGEGRLVASCFGIAVPTALLVTHALRQHLHRSRSPLIIVDASVDGRLADRPDDGLGACVGMSLHGIDGRVVGSLLVMGMKPRSWTRLELDFIGEVAALITEVEPAASTPLRGRRTGVANASPRGNVMVARPGAR